MEKITIWTVLNDTAGLLQARHDEITGIFKKNGYNAVFGNRTKYDAKLINYHPDNLVPDEEYFVPIIAKSLGSLLDSDNARIKRIYDYYIECGQSDYKVFWGERYDYSMATKKFLGYYQLLQANKPNFLISHSQGALLSYFLSWLAENVFNEPDLIAGNIMISSSNFGSPLANPENLKNIIIGLIDIMLIVFPPAIRKVADEIAEIILNKLIPEEAIVIILDFFTDFIQELRQLIINIKNDKLEKKLLQFINLIANLTDWLGGLLDNVDNAFFDLNILRMEETYKSSSGVSGYENSILACVNNDDLKNTYCANIISTDNSLEDLLEDIFPNIFYTGINTLKQTVKKFPKFNISNLNGALKNFDTGKFSKERLKKLGKEIQDIYSEKIMKENINLNNITNDKIKKILNYHNKGISEKQVLPGGIKKLSHDFIIPSAYQLYTYANTDIIKSENIPNYKANHMSACDPDVEAGEHTVKEIKKIIEAFLKN